ncbi:hypothetical protein ABOM_003977 [Aspergillus bombycis]|uniref:Zn(2)-C6 fungal-type domain-containing protein n=1 Tax=Aspergillus bombycis TaxID=109264 RepID=A0A1F8A645_9EURO|nr:hypothetical protein ABOM_003977 [Aspergillus bombycis]OGM47174.1 hypothetical protein ABOM_003977 [Aspergillus bombycis]
MPQRSRRRCAKPEFANDSNTISALPTHLNHLVYTNTHRETVFEFHSMRPSACDRCHTVRSRCLAGPGETCYRCYRLHYPCTYSRRRQRPGRKPRVASVAASASRTDRSDTARTLDTSVVATHGQRNDETRTRAPKIELLSLLRWESTVSRVSEYTAVEICQFFSLGELLSREMSQMIRARIREAPMLLLDPYAAVTRVLLRSTTNQPACSDSDWSSCASALQVLRNAQITSPEHAGNLLSLGLSLVTFHRLISGISASTICRFTLSLVRPLYYSEQLQESDMRELLCLVFLDVTESLFRARIPVIEYRVRDPYLVNHHAGLCGSLLPLLYRVCLLRVAIRKEPQVPIPPDQFDNLREEIVAWAPTVSAATIERFSEQEMVLLLTQANLHRNATLLILHRLRYPFGEGDDDAETLARTMITEMQHCLAMAKQHPPNIALVLLVAGAEVHDSFGRQNILSLLQSIKGSSFYPFVANLRVFLTRVWTSRDEGTTRYLFDLFDHDDNLSIPL